MSEKEPFKVSSDNNLGVDSVVWRCMVSTAKDLNDDVLVEIYSAIEDSPDGSVTMDELTEQIDVTRRTINNKINSSEIIERDDANGQYHGGASLVRFRGGAVVERAALLALACHRVNEREGVPSGVVFEQ